MKFAISLCISSFLLATALPALAETKIVSWNVSPQLLESVRARQKDMSDLNVALEPDVLILLEVAGLEEAKVLADGLNWPSYYVAVTDWAKMRNNMSFALEAAVISKLPIEKVIEYDPKPDGTHPVIDQIGAEVSVPVSEVEVDATGIPSINQLSGFNRVSMRVDLSNGLSVFPVHLKSSRNSTCYLASDINKNLKRLGLPENPNVPDMLENGFAAATKETVRSAMKRERVIAAVKLAADKAESSDVLIAGDFNTLFEPGKVGSSFGDCTLQDFSCEKSTLPADACSDSDGFDDTFAILSESLVGNGKWTILTESLGSTYEDKAFAHHAIDHMAIPVGHEASFERIGKGSDTYGSDHYTIFVSYDQGQIWE